MAAPKPKVSSMNKPLHQAHVVFLSDRPIQFPASVVEHVGQLTPLIFPQHRFFHFLSSLQCNWRLRNLHATNPIDAIIIDHPKFVSDNLRSFTRKFNIPLIADNLNNTFDHSIITRSQYHGFIASSMCANGNQPSGPIDTHTAVVPLSLSNPQSWKLAGYKSQITSLVVVALNAHPAEYNKLITALDIVKSLDPEMTLDIITANDQNPDPLIKRLRKGHVIINIASDPAWIETAALAVAAGIPLITPKRPIHRYIHPKLLPGYIVGDWQIDTLATVIQNSITHPEETYRIAKNAQHWLKTNLGATFLPMAWVSGLSQLLSPDLETNQSSAPIPLPK